MNIPSIIALETNLDESVPCSGLANESPKVRNRPEVPQFVGVQDPADRLHTTVRDVQREGLMRRPSLSNVMAPG